MRPTRLLALLCLAGALAALAAAGLAAGRLVDLPLARAAAAFLACFGLGKILLGLDAVAQVRLVPAGGADPRLDYGRPLLFWLWVGFKFAAGAASLVAATLLWGRLTAFSP